MLDHDHGIAVITQPVQHRQQVFHVMEMQSGGGFVQNIQGVSGVPLGQFPGQFDPLRLASRQGGGILSQLDIREAYVHQGL